MACPLGVVLVGHGRTKQRHDPVAGKLVDGAFILVDLIHQDLKAPVHDLVDLLGVQLLGECRIIRHIGKQDGHPFSFPFNRTPVGENFVRKEFRGI